MFFIKRLYPIFLLLLVSCGSNEHDIELRIKELLNVDLPDEYEIVLYEAGGLNDFTIRYELLFEESSFNQLIDKLDVVKWERTYEQVYSKDFSPESNIHIYIEIIPEKYLLIYQLIQE